MRKVWIWAFGVPALVLGMIVMSFNGEAEHKLAQASVSAPMTGR
jgi:hypothetical protein